MISKSSSFNSQVYIHAIFRLPFFLVFLMLILTCSQSEGDDKSMKDKKDVHYNRLIHEKSPYLLQHATNPVDWYPWGEEAFRAAKEQDKPIFLSIGYATCHWCHVMEHESFEDSTVAALMNESFISIKVDREERPDIDDIYMTVCQMLNGSGGWPLTIIMTPDKQPFFAGTYIPKKSYFDRIGMLDLIPRVANLWKTDRQKLLDSAEKISEHLSNSVAAPPGKQIGEQTLRQATELLTSRFDEQYGGFGERPKFPTAHQLMFLLREYHRNGDDHTLEMVTRTLDHMRMGGIYDHIGFGFHRYSTDEKWLLPHFEKMLYDQAINSMAYTEAFLATGTESYRQTAREIFTYVLRDMTDTRGGFYSAEDADSEGEEGKFYLWSREEIMDILGTEAGELFCKVYSIEKDGNFREEASKRQTGTSIPHLQKPLNQWAKELNMSLETLQAKLENSRQKLFEVREKRVHPLKDDKILTDWNGLMIAALSKGARAFDEPAYTNAARKATDFILNTMRDKQGRLMHRYREGEVAINGFLDDYAFMIWGLIELYETTFKTRYLQAALELTERVLTHFPDKQNGGFFFTPDDGEQLLVRKKEVYDGAIPSGNSVMMYNLVRLARMTGRSELEEQAAGVGKAFSETINRYPAGYTVLLMGVDFAIGPTYEIVITGDPARQDTREMVQAIYSRFIPNKVLLLKPEQPQQPGITQLADFTQSLSTIDGKATAYVCRNFACELPTTDVEKMLSLMQVKP